MQATRRPAQVTWTLQAHYNRLQNETISGTSALFEESIWDAGNASPSASDLDTTGTPVAATLVIAVSADGVLLQEKSFPSSLSLSSGGATAPFCFITPEMYNAGDLASTAEVSYSCSTGVKAAGVVSVAMANAVVLTGVSTGSASRRRLSQVGDLTPEIRAFSGGSTPGDRALTPRMRRLQQDGFGQPSSFPTSTTTLPPAPAPVERVCKVR